MMSTIDNNVRQRVVWVDVIRAISFLLIITSHVMGSDNIVYQLIFGFNVPCMVLLSGYVASTDRSASAIEYYKKRFLRIVIPSWIYFALYFMLVELLSIGQLYPYSVKQIVMTFVFMDGIGYTWILAVFLMIAVIVPVIRFLSQKYKTAIVIVMILYLIIGIFLFITYKGFKLEKLLLYCLSYSFLTIVGYHFEDLIKNGKAIILFSSVNVFLIFYVLITGKFAVYDIRVNKYPPSIYYVMYGILVFAILYIICKMLRLEDKNNIFIKSIIYISKNGFDIYLWHIFALYLTEKMINKHLRLVLVLVISLFISYIYRKILKIINNRLLKVEV